MDTLGFTLLALSFGSTHGWFDIPRNQCPMHSCIGNGKVRCGGRNHGHTCNFGCEDGYTLVGNRNIECLKSGQWSHPHPQCVAKECPELPNPANSKGYMCTNGQKVGSICWLRCDETKGYLPDREIFTMCTVFQIWTNLRMECLDIEAPQIQNCPTQTLVKSKDRNSALTYVKWDKPLTVTDNSGDKLEVEAIGAQATAKGGLFKEGVTLVRFIAQDRARNTSPMCAFIVKIQKTDVSELHILLGMTSPNIGVLDMANLNYRDISLTPTFTGDVDYMAYNPRDSTIFFSTQSPSTIGGVRFSGQNQTELMTFPDGTVVTGLDVDIESDLLLYMTNQGVLAAYHIVTGAQWTLLSDLPSSDGLVLDQEFGIYWMETATIRYMHYGDETPRTLYTDTHTIWGLSIDYQDKRLMWQSANRLRSSNTDGSDPQTLSLRFSSRFGATDEYFFTIIKEGNTQKMKKENRDRLAVVSMHVVPEATWRMKVINSTIPHTADHPCLPSHSDCEQACLPLNTTTRRCFCRPDFTLQSDLMSCRRDFSVDFETTDPYIWYRPMRKDYSIPPSKTLRFNVKACHSAKLALAKTGRELYVLRLDHLVNNRTRMDLMKHSPFRPKVLLQEKEISLLNCNEFKTFWITWKKDEARGTQALKIGYGSVVGSNILLNVADAFPYTVNFLQFSVGINATAHWQF